MNEILRSNLEKIEESARLREIAGLPVSRRSSSMKGERPSLLNQWMLESAREVRRLAFRCDTLEGTLGQLLKILSREAEWRDNRARDICAELLRLLEASYEDGYPQAPEDQKTDSNEATSIPSPQSRGSREGA